MSVKFPTEVTTALLACIPPHPGSSPKLSSSRPAVSSGDSKATSGIGLPPPPPLPVSSVTTQPPKVPPPLTAPFGHRHFHNILDEAFEVLAQFSYTPPSVRSSPKTKTHELAIVKGDLLTVLAKTNDVWWFVEKADGSRGYVPTNHVKLVSDLRVDCKMLGDRIAYVKSGAMDEDYAYAYEDEEYFSGYSGLKIHQEMLGDKPRTEGYFKAICEVLAPAIKDKVVLDVGCGTGVLSMFCAKAGAKHVYGIEASDMAMIARKLVADNGLSGKVSIIKGRCEQVFLPVETVDVIVSEWMGSLLVTESMLFSVMKMRNRYLKGAKAQRPSDYFAVSGDIYTADTLPPTEVPFFEAVTGTDVSTDSAFDGGVDIATESGSADFLDSANPSTKSQPKLLAMDKSAESEIIMVEEKMSDSAIAAESQSDTRTAEMTASKVAAVISGSDGMGLMLPGFCRMWFAAIDMSKYFGTYVDMFDDICGLDFGRFKGEAKQEYLGMATFFHKLQADELLSSEQMAMAFDMHTVDEDWFTVRKWQSQFRMQRDGTFGGFGAWFDCRFAAPAIVDKLLLETGPKTARTHWSQTLFLVNEQVPVSKGDVVAADFTLFRNCIRHRNFYLRVECAVNGRKFKQMFHLWD